MVYLLICGVFVDLYWTSSHHLLLLLLFQLLQHPNAASGPPVRLENKHKSERTVSLEEYEQTRSPRRKRRQMRLSYQDRKDMLTKQHTVDEVNHAWAEARRIRLQREETLRRGLLLMTWDDICESMDRKYKRTLGCMGL